LRGAFGAAAFLTAGFFAGARLALATATALFSAVTSAAVGSTAGCATSTDGVSTLYGAAPGATASTGLAPNIFFNKPSILKISLSVI
jgi:hypothetical protein